LSALAAHEGWKPPRCINSNVASKNRHWNARWHCWNESPGYLRLAGIHVGTVGRHMQARHDFAGVNGPDRVTIVRRGNTTPLVNSPLSPVQANHQFRPKGYDGVFAQKRRFQAPERLK
jgi:hypothetical protein